MAGGASKKGTFISLSSIISMFVVIIFLAGNVANMLATCRPDPRCCSNFGQMGPCCQHKIDDVGTCLCRLVTTPIFPAKKKLAHNNQPNNKEANKKGQRLAQHHHHCHHCCCCHRWSQRIVVVIVCHMPCLLLLPRLLLLLRCQSRRQCSWQF